MTNLIKTASTGSMNNAYFVAFHQSVKAMIDKAGVANLGINQTDFSKYGHYIQLLNDAVLRTQGSDKTALVAAYDEERDKLFRYIRNVFANLKYSTDKELIALYETALAKILKVYTSKIANEGNQEETAHINGFIVDVRKFFGDQLTKLGISGVLTALETANENFQKAYLERTTELANIEEGMTEKYRAEVEECYERIALTINYYNIQTNSSDETITEIRTVCIDFTLDLNQYISEIWQSIKLSKALKKEEKHNSNGTSTKPSGGSSTGGNSNPSGGSTSPGGDDIL